ncbi:glycosyltransferase family 2 protein [Parabacteroides sp.]
MEEELISNVIFSVIIPVYNSELYLEKCLDSLLEQSYPDFEVLLIDDGSTDKSGAICDEYAKKDTRFRVFHQKNEGVSAARNKGLSVARGKYISFVDSDDWVTPDYLKVYADARAAFDYDLVYIEMVIVLGNEKSTPFSLKDVVAEKKNELPAMLKFLLLEYKGFGFTCNKSFKRELINRYNLRFDRNYSMGEDRLFSLEYCCYTQSIRLSSAQTYYYRMDESSLSHKGVDFNFSYRMALDKCRIVKRLGYTSDMGMFDSLRKQFTVKAQQEGIQGMYLLGKSLNRRERLLYLKIFADRFGYGYTGSRVLDFGLNLKKDGWADLFLYSVYFVHSLFSKRK